MATSQGRVERPADEDLVARLRAGDDEAFGALVTRHRPWLVRLCTRLLGNDAHAAEDAAQESLLKLHAVARRDPRPLRVRPWLSVVARRTCVDEHRRRRADLPGELPDRPAASEGPFHLDPSLAQAWSQLAGRHREVLYLREVLGLSYKEIAGVMDLSLASVETLIFRARAALRREYERAGGRHFGCGLLGLGLFGLAAGDRRLQASAHVAGCDHCRQAVDGLRSAGNLLRASAPAADVVSTIGTKLPSGAGGGLDLGAGLDLGGLSQRAMHLFATLPDSGQSVGRLLSTAAGVVMAAASVIPAVVVPAAPARPGGNGEVVAGEAGSATGRRTELASGWNGGGSPATAGSDRPAQPAWSDGLASGQSYEGSAGGRTDSAALGDKTGPRASVSPGKAPRRTGKTPAVDGVDRPKATPAPRPVLAPRAPSPSPDVPAPPPPDPVTPPDRPPTPDPDGEPPSPAVVPETPDVPPAPGELDDPPAPSGRELIATLGQAVPILG